MTTKKKDAKIKVEDKVKRKKRAFPWWILLTLLLAGLGGGAIWFFVGRGRPGETQETQEAPVVQEKEYTVEDLLREEPPKPTQAPQLAAKPQEPETAAAAPAETTAQLAVPQVVGETTSVQTQPAAQEGPKAPDVPQVSVVELPKEKLGKGEKLVINPKNKPEQSSALPDVKLDIDLGGISPTPGDMGAPAGPSFSGGTFQLEEDLKKAYRVEHNLTKAKSLARKILKKNPSNPTARKYMKIIKAEMRARMFEKQGNREAALKEWKKVLQWDPGNKWAKEGVSRNQ